MPVIFMFVMSALFVALTLWLHGTKSSAYIFAGLIASVMVLVLVLTIHRFLFYKVWIGEDGFYYQTGPSNGKYYDYIDVEKAWISSGTAQHGAREDFCNISIPGKAVIRFQFFYNDSKGVEYLVKRVEASAGKGTEGASVNNGEYLIDGKAFGMTSIVVACVLLIIVTVLETFAFQRLGNIYLLISGLAMAIAVLVYTIIHNRYFKVQIGDKGFYYRSNPFNGRYYKYGEILTCREIKKVVRFRQKNRTHTMPRYYFFFEFTDVRGKKQKFSFSKPIHEHEVNVLKERIEKAKYLQSDDRS